MPWRLYLIFSQIAPPVVVSDYRRRAREGFPKEAAAGFLQLEGLSYSFEGNHWSTPPVSVVSSGLEAIVRYYDSINCSGATESWTLKVVALGATCAGKSSVVQSLLARKPKPVDETDRTRGVDVKAPFKPCNSKSAELVFWDFAGHDDYHSTHSLFLSEGALFLLVVDLARFWTVDSTRNDAIYTWLDMLLCRTPGAIVQIVATHIDQFDNSTSNYEGAAQELKKEVSDHLAAKYMEHEDGLIMSGKQGRMSNPPLLRIIDKIRAVSCTDGDDWPAFGEALAKIATEGTEKLLSPPPPNAFQGAGWAEGRLFPGVGKTIPEIWARACAVMDALRDGLDLQSAASLKQPLPSRNPRIQHLSLEAAASEWKAVLAAPESHDFSHQIGSERAETVLEVRGRRRHV